MTDTNYGTGLVLPIAKILGHMTALQHMIDTGLDSTAANSEFRTFRDAHIVTVPEWLTYEAKTTIGDWQSMLAARLGYVGHGIPHGETNSASPLREAIIQTWELLVLLDKELVGLTQASPGNTP